MIHFEVALQLTSDHFHRCNAIDFACADGPLIPSLSKYYNEVIAIDSNPKYILYCQKLIAETGLSNVKPICNKNITIGELQDMIQGRNYCIMYLLEALEHIGELGNQYESQVQFLKDLFNIMDDGMIVISVPKMFGPSYLLQTAGLYLLGQSLDNRGRYSLLDMIKKGLFINTEEYEARWHYGHEGFNYKKMEKKLRDNFTIIKMVDILFQRVYLIKY